MILENGVVKYLTVEDNPQKTSCTMAGHVLEALGETYYSKTPIYHKPRYTAAISFPSNRTKQ